jgi:N-acetylmuramoyl-L-alanine amidase
VNLAIGTGLAELLRILGFEVRMTREDDRSIHDASAGSLREQKVSDMHNRLAMYNQASLVISIHQNQFPQAQYHGTQVFYAPLNSDSKRLGESIRANVIALLQPQNTRELKKGEKSLYLLSNATPPTALVECGFLSNPEECAKLNNADYRRQMAFAVAGGLLQYLSET